MSLIEKVMSFERENADVVRFHQTSIINKLFSLLLLKNFKCPKGHKSGTLMTSLGLILRRPRAKETLNGLIESYFA